MSIELRIKLEVENITQARAACGSSPSQLYIAWMSCTGDGI